MGILDIFFPKKCVSCRKMGEYLCAACFAQISFETPSKCLICDMPCIDSRTHPKCHGLYTIDGYVASVAYKRVMKKMLYQFKYQPFLVDLKTTLSDLMYENLIQSELFTNLLKEDPILIPIPLSSSKMRKRGYNQSEILAKELGKKIGLNVVNLLKRAKNTKPQYGLKREERLENMKGAFEVNLKLKNQKSKFECAFLVDDVVTTGSTLREAAKVLKKNGFEKVWGLVLAQD
ncbi:MAG TPA: ComF family protein [Patescibacteria group bacterium]